MESTKECWVTLFKDNEREVITVTLTSWVLLVLILVWCLLSKKYWGRSRELSRSTQDSNLEPPDDNMWYTEMIVFRSQVRYPITPADPLITMKKQWIWALISLFVVEEYYFVTLSTSSIQLLMNCRLRHIPHYHQHSSSCSSSSMHASQEGHCCVYRNRNKRHTN